MGPSDDTGADDVTPAEEEEEVVTPADAELDEEEAE